MSQFIVIAPDQTNVLHLYHKIFIVKTELEYHKRCLHNLGILHDQLERWVRDVKKILYDVIFKDGDKNEEDIFISKLCRNIDWELFSSYFHEKNFGFKSIADIKNLALLDSKSRETFWASVKTPNTTIDNNEMGDLGTGTEKTNDNFMFLNFCASMEYYSNPVMTLNGNAELETFYIKKKQFDRRCLELCDFFISCETKTKLEIKEVVDRLNKEYAEAFLDNTTTKNNIKPIYHQITILLEGFIHLHDIVQTDGITMKRSNLKEYLKGDKDRTIYLYPAYEPSEPWLEETKQDKEKREELYKRRPSAYEKDDIEMIKHTDKKCDPYTPCYKCWSIRQTVHFCYDDYILEPPDNVMIFNRKGYFSGFLLSSVDSENNKFTTLMW